MKLILVVLLLGLTACNSAWDKDPFKDDSINVKNRVPQGTKAKGTPPLQSVVFIKLEPFYELKEGRKLIIETGYTITHPEFKFLDFKIHDLEESFPGAVFDPATNEITWVPEEGYVPPTTIVYRTPLTLSVLVEYKGIQHEVRKSTSINVLRGDSRAPYIKEIVGIEDLKEGEVKKFHVIVQDEVSPNGPTLSIRNQYSSFNGNGAGYIRHDVSGRQDPSDPTLWKYEGSIDLSGAREITKEYIYNSVAFTAHSTFGESSQIFSESFNIKTNLAKPSFFSQNIPTFKKGVLNTYTFSVADPKQEGKLEAEFITDCSREPVAGSDCSCVRSKIHFYYSTCTINWVPPAAGTFEYEVKATNSLDTFMVKQSVDETEVIKVKVVD